MKYAVYGFRLTVDNFGKKFYDSFYFFIDAESKEQAYSILRNKYGLNPPHIISGILKVDQ
jgi:hypothetical protein